jgi:hypothetical protein
MLVLLSGLLRTVVLTDAVFGFAAFTVTAAVSLVLLLPNKKYK